MCELLSLKDANAYKNARKMRGFVAILAFHWWVTVSHDAPKEGLWLDEMGAY